MERPGSKWKVFPRTDGRPCVKASRRPPVAFGKERYYSITYLMRSLSSGGRGSGRSSPLRANADASHKGSYGKYLSIKVWPVGHKFFFGRSFRVLLCHPAASQPCPRIGRGARGKSTLNTRSAFAKGGLSRRLRSRLPWLLVPLPRWGKPARSAGGMGQLLLPSYGTCHILPLAFHHHPTPTPSNPLPLYIRDCG